MALNDDSDDDLQPLTFDASSGKALDPPRKRRSQVRLKTLDDVKKEMEKLYRAAKNDEILPKKANSLIYILEKVMAITVAKEYGTRLEAIEQKLLQGFDDTPRIPD